MSQLRAKCILLLIFFGFGCLYAERLEYQGWFFNSTKFKINERKRFYFENEERWGDQISHLILTYVQLRYGVQIGKYFEVAPGYRQQWDLVGEKWQPRYDPLVDITWTHKFGKWQVRDRVRSHYFFKPDGDNHWTIRNFTQLSLDLKSLSPFVADEVFFREYVGFFENRLLLGAQVPVSDKLKCSVYYMWRRVKPVSWVSTRIFGTFILINY